MKEYRPLDNSDKSLDLFTELKKRKWILAQGASMNEGIVEGIRNPDWSSLVDTFPVPSPQQWEETVTNCNEIAAAATGYPVEAIESIPLDFVPIDTIDQPVIEYRRIPLTPHIALQEEYVHQPDGTGEVRFFTVRPEEIPPHLQA